MPPDLGMHREVRIPLARPLLAVGESRVTHRPPIDELLLPERQGPERLREHRHALDLHRHLARPRAEERSRHADDVAEVKRRQYGETLAKLVLPEVELDAARVIGEMGEDRLAVATPRHQPPRKPDHRARLRVTEEPGRRAGTMSSIEAVRERRLARRLQRGELLAARLQHEVELLAHPSLPGEPVCLRYASMKGSMAPSMTFCTSGIFSSVRWSLTIV